MYSKTSTISSVVFSLSCSFLAIFNFSGAYAFKRSAQEPKQLVAHTQREESIAKELQSAIPDIETRDRVKDLQADEIKSIRLSGQLTGYKKNSPLEISDPQICSLFLSALKQAVFRGYIARSRSSCLRLIVKEKINQSPRIIGFNFNTRSGFPLECFGLPFAHALDMIGEYQAQQLRLLITKKKTQIYGVTIIDGPDIKRSAVLHNLLEELEHADGSIYAYSSPGMEIKMSLFIRDEGEIPLHFVLHSLPADEPYAQAKVPFAFRQAYYMFRERNDKINHLDTFDKSAIFR